MKHTLALLTPLLIASLAGLRGADSPKPGARPNILVIITDDHGWADLGAQAVRKDIRTPHLDELASGGLRAVSGYVTAPQCVPSRAGLLSGRYQNRFGVESNAESVAPFAAARTIAERLKEAGYVTGMAGKWHLGDNQKIAEHGFDQVFFKHSNAPGLWNMDLAGQDVTPAEQRGGGYHLHLIADFACAFIKRYANQPFFFYLAPRAPHTPLDAPPKYTSRFPGEMPERRRQALAMISAIDDGVNLIPFFTRENKAAPHARLYWRWTSQSAIREGKWKLLRGGPREYLFDLEADPGEKENRLATHPDIATRLRDQLRTWGADLRPPGVESASLSRAATAYFDYYLEGKPAARPAPARLSEERAAQRDERKKRR